MDEVTARINRDIHRNSTSSSSSDKYISRWKKYSKYYKKP